MITPSDRLLVIKWTTPIYLSKGHRSAGLVKSTVLARNVYKEPISQFSAIQKKVKNVSKQFTISFFSM